MSQSHSRQSSDYGRDCLTDTARSGLLIWADHNGDLDKRSTFGKSTTHDSSIHGYMQLVLSRAMRIYMGIIA